MPIRKSQQKAVTKYMKEHYDSINVRVPKGKKDIIKSVAEKNGDSINGFVNKAIDERIKKIEQDE